VLPQVDAPRAQATARNEADEAEPSARNASAKGRFECNGEAEERDAKARLAPPTIRPVTAGSTAPQMGNILSSARFSASPATREGA
jgi:hypothetical protein